MPEVEEYKHWLASGVSNREVIETFEITHSNWGAWRIANSDRDLNATVGGNKYRFQAARFYMEPPETTDTMNQVTTVSVSALNGFIYDKVRGLTFDERVEPIEITYRLFFSDDPSESLVTPPPVWSVQNLEATREAVRFELQATQMRVQRIGLYYTAKEFPALVYL